MIGNIQSLARLFGSLRADHADLALLARSVWCRCRASG